jgi:hypothetical protein
MATTVFALELIQTSQGWVEPANPLPANDIPDDELAKLKADGKVVYAEHDSPLAARAHEIRRAADKSTATTAFQDAARSLSLESPDHPPTPATDDEQHLPVKEDNSPQTTAAPMVETRGEAEMSKSPTAAPQGRRSR